MRKTATSRWDPAAHLETEEDMAAYLEAALEEGEPSLVAAALGDIARAKGMSRVARATGLGRESLYRALSASGNPEFATILKVIAALGLRFHAEPAGVKAMKRSRLARARGDFDAATPGHTGRSLADELIELRRAEAETE